MGCRLVAVVIMHVHKYEIRIKWIKTSAKNNLWRRHLWLPISNHFSYFSGTHFILRVRKRSTSMSLYLRIGKAFILLLTKIQLEIKFLFMKVECPGKQGIFFSSANNCMRDWIRAKSLLSLSLSLSLSLCSLWNHFKNVQYAPRAR